MKKFLILFLFSFLICTFFAQTSTTNVHIKRLTAFYDQAVLENNKGNYDAAVDNLDSMGGYMFINQMPFYDTTFLQARDSLVSASILLLNNCIKHKPNAYNFSVRGTFHGLSGDYVSGISDLTLAIQHDSSNSMFFYNRGLFYRQINHNDAALADYTYCILIDKNYAGAYLNRGYLYMELGKYDLAKGDFLMALELTESPKEESYLYNNLGFLYYKTGEFDLALEYINISLELNGQNSYAYKNKALVEIEQKNLIDACQSLDLATQLGFSNKYGNEVDLLIKKYCGE